MKIEKQERKKEKSLKHTEELPTIKIHTSNKKFAFVFFFLLDKSILFIV